MARTNPLNVPNAMSFPAWAVDDNGLRLLLFWPLSDYDNPAMSSLRFYISDQVDAMHVLVTHAAELPAQIRDTGYDGVVMAHTMYQQAEVSLPSVLGDRPVVDATEGVARPEVSSGADFCRRMVPDPGAEADVRDFEQTQRSRWTKSLWDYDDDHKIIEFVVPSGSQNESRSVPVRAFGSLS